MTHLSQSNFFTIRIIADNQSLNLEARS
jgi:hypothetical protein